MKKMLAIGLVLLSICVCAESVQAVTFVKSSNYPAAGNTTSAYSNDLRFIEQYLFGTVYPNESTKSRLNRVERCLFNRTYSTMGTAQRMNNVLANYRRNVNYNSYEYNNRNYVTNGYYRSMRPMNRVINRITGQPTGFTPPIMHNTPLGSRINPAFSRGFVNNRGGYAYRNVYPTTTGAGITILD